MTIFNIYKRLKNNYLNTSFVENIEVK